MASSSGSAHPAWHYNTQTYPSPYHAPLPYPPNGYDADQAAHHDFYAFGGDQRLIAIVQHGANLELDKLKLLESKYRGKELRRWADNFKQSYGDVDGVEEALHIVMRNEGMEGDSAPFISTLMHALRDEPSAHPTSVARIEPSLGRALESAQPAAAAATRADSRARLQSWLRSPAVAEIDGAKRRRIIDERALITEFPLRTPKERDTWSEHFCQAFFPHKQEFFMEDVNIILKEVVAGLGTEADAVDREVSRLLHSLAKTGVCNTKSRRSKPNRPAQKR